MPMNDLDLAIADLSRLNANPDRTQSEEMEMEGLKRLLFPLDTPSVREIVLLRLFLKKIADFPLDEEIEMSNVPNAEINLDMLESLIREAREIRITIGNPALWWMKR